MVSSLANSWCNYLTKQNECPGRATGEAVQPYPRSTTQTETTPSDSYGAMSRWGQDSRLDVIVNQATAPVAELTVDGRIVYIDSPLRAINKGADQYMHKDWT